MAEEDPMDNRFLLDGQAIPFQAGQTVLEAALAAGVQVPHLCYHPGLAPSSSCRLCSVLVDGRPGAACTQPAAAGIQVVNHSPELDGMRRSLLQMLFIEGNHYCPSCEVTGSCQLQATAYEAGMQDSHFAHAFPRRGRDASHPDILLDLDRCILCQLCVRASRELDGKNVFAIRGRGIQSELVVNSPSGLLLDSGLEVGDRAANIGPVGAILVKGRGYRVPIGERRYDREPISVVAVREARDGR